MKMTSSATQSAVVVREELNESQTLLSTWNIQVMPNAQVG
jgi:hypothetical protein